MIPFMESSKNLSHDEIWDDSALVNSWNDALDEYNVSAVHRPNLDQVDFVARNITASMPKVALLTIFQSLLKRKDTSCMVLTCRHLISPGPSSRAPSLKQSQQASLSRATRQQTNRRATKRAREFHFHRYVMIKQPAVKACRYDAHPACKSWEISKAWHETTAPPAPVSTFCPTFLFRWKIPITYRVTAG